MSRMFGMVRQNGYVVRDIWAAMQHWIEVLGVGPWFYVERAPLEEYHYKGKPYSIDLSMALSNSGSLQIELIQQRNDAPSMYQDFVTAGHEGLHHLAFWPQPFEDGVARYLQAGYRIGQQGRVGHPGRFVYLETEGHPGTVVELSDISGPKGRMFDRIAEAARNWDGKEPIRRIWPLD